MSMSTPDIKNMKNQLGNKYFDSSQVGSCSYILIQNGQALAIPFNVKKKNATYNNIEKSPRSTYK